MKVFCVTFHFPVRVIHFPELFILRYTSPVYTRLSHPHSITSDFHFRICDFQIAGWNEISFILRYTSSLFTPASLTLTPSHQIFTFAFVIFKLLAQMRSFLSCDTPAARLNLPHCYIRFSHLHLQPRLFSNYVYLAIHQQPVYTKGVRLTLDPSFQTFTFAFVTIIGNDHWTLK